MSNPNTLLFEHPVRRAKGKTFGSRRHFEILQVAVIHSHLKSLVKQDTRQVICDQRGNLAIGLVARFTVWHTCDLGDQGIHILAGIARESGTSPNLRLHTTNTHYLVSICAAMCVRSRSTAAAVGYGSFSSIEAKIVPLMSVS